MTEGFRFACQPGCTSCCRQRGFVYLNDADLERAAGFLGVTPEEFERQYVRRTRNTMRFRVPPQAHCPFLVDDGCSIHPAKPAQCRAFPFWPELIASRREWKRTANYCPGIGQGPLIRIEAALVKSRDTGADDAPAPAPPS